MSTVFKVCCIQNFKEAKLATHYGATYLGFVSAMPTGFRLLSDEQIQTIIKDTTALTSKNVLLTSICKEKDLLNQIEFTQPDAVQLVDDFGTSIHHAIKKRFPTLEIFQVIHVLKQDDVQKVVDIQESVDYILLDSGKSKNNKKALGGTGTVHDWSISAAIVAAASKPVFLAGGLHPHNIKEAIEKVNPFGVDICTGLRDPKFLVEEKLMQLQNMIN